MPGDDRSVLVVWPAAGGPAREFPIPIGNFADPYHLERLVWHLSWLPDGSGLSFTRAGSDQQPVLFHLTLATGQWEQSSLPGGVPTWWPSAEWTRDGRAYLTNTSPGKDQPERILEYEAESRRSRVVWTADRSITRVRRLSLSPDRKAIAFMAERRTEDEVHKGVMVLDLETGRARAIGPTKAGKEAPYLREAPASWSPDQRHLIVHVNNEKGSQFHLLPLNGGNPRRLNLEGRTPRGAPAWSPDGKQVTFAVTTLRSENWALDSVIPPAQTRSPNTTAGR